MNPLRRLFVRVDGRVSSSLRGHVDRALPARVSSPLAILNTHSSSVERVGSFEHCRCCSRFPTRLACPVIHRSPCDRPSCGQSWPGEPA